MYKETTDVQILDKTGIIRRVIDNATKTGKEAYPATVIGVRLVEACLPA